MTNKEELTNRLIATIKTINRIMAAIGYAATGSVALALVYIAINK